MWTVIKCLHDHMYRVDNKEPHLTGVVMHYLLVSNNAAALTCKRHETGVKMQQKFAFLPEVSPCECSLHVM